MRIAREKWKACLLGLYCRRKINTKSPNKDLCDKILPCKPRGPAGWYAVERSPQDRRQNRFTKKEFIDDKAVNTGQTPARSACFRKK